MSNKTKKEKSPDGSMSISGHLKELRNRVLICVIVLLVGFCACLGIAPKLVTIFTDMGKPFDYEFVYLAPQELLMEYFSIAFVGSLIISFPVLAYHIYAFCSPGLTQKERNYIKIGLFSGTVFFVLGIVFARLVSVPFMLRFLISFTGEVSVSASISIQQYISFLLTVFLIFGIVFEMPVVTVVLTALGILRAEWLAKGRKIMIVAIFFLAAVITPPDVISQILIAVPMLLLYEISIILCRIVGKKRKQAAEAAEEEE
ncbi:MAG: twin-arginine translocase subunit TatC [Oscillospiraceae bacterium]|nr:twin-arginine translocase subunit TatC [Oscillospiraceae bacterium]